jgi:hypothetical protein
MVVPSLPPLQAMCMQIPFLPFPQPNLPLKYPLVPTYLSTLVLALKIEGETDHPSFPLPSPQGLLLDVLLTAGCC